MSKFNDKPSRRTIQSTLEARAEIHQLLGQIITVLITVPRYHAHPISDLVEMIIDPLMRGRLLTARPKSLFDQASVPGGLSGLVIWATVSEHVNTKLLEQIEADAFPIRLTGDEWRSGDRLWILDVVAPTVDLAKSILLQFRQSKSVSEVSLHPHLARLFDPGFLSLIVPAYRDLPKDSKTLN